MNQEQLRKKIEYSLNEGFSEQEIRQALRQQGVKHSKINQAINQVKNGGNQKESQRQQNRQNQRGQQDVSSQNDSQGFSSQNQGNQNFGQGNQQRGQQNRGRQRRQQNSQNQRVQQNVSSQNDSQGFSSQNQGNQNFGQGNQQKAAQSRNTGSGLNLNDSYYRIKQQLLLSRYSVFDENDNKILKAKKKIFSIKTDIPFRKPEEEESLFRVISSRFPNISNNYKVKDEQEDETVAILDRKRTLLNQVWRIRNPQDNSIVATIQNENTMLQFLRTYGGLIPVIPNFFALAPHTYNITDVNDNQIGELEGELSIRDEYELNLQDSGQLEREDMISSIIAIDALEGN